MDITKRYLASKRAEIECILDKDFGTVTLSGAYRGFGKSTAALERIVTDENSILIVGSNIQRKVFWYKLQDLEMEGVISKEEQLAIHQRILVLKNGQDFRGHIFNTRVDIVYLDEATRDIYLYLKGCQIPVIRGFIQSSDCFEKV